MEGHKKGLLLLTTLKSELAVSGAPLCAMFHNQINPLPPIGIHLYKRARVKRTVEQLNKDALVVRATGVRLRPFSGYASF